MTPNNPRLLAVETLSRVTGQGGYSNLTLDHVINSHKLTPRDAGLLDKHRLWCDPASADVGFYLAPFIKGRKLDNWIRCLLDTAVYQLQYLDKVPARAVFDSTEIAKKLGHQGIAKFVTGVLRNAQRTGFPDPAAISDPVKRLSIESSTPVWLVEKLTAQLGEPKPVPF